jgi:hypothetical protein
MKYVKPSTAYLSLELELCSISNTIEAEVEGEKLKLY